MRMRKYIILMLVTALVTVLLTGCDQKTDMVLELGLTTESKEATETRYK